ncbi:MAG: pyridoxamine 5'-phosphate oxidase [Candidatus Abyssobacteria bacterium SURF_17]|jgi:predicted pyridoxine 5'-phosphate oxidase superfamily flavin-nucleotide-binding protein|uniref:Pyridoxamine 5'-phosphate oxidase n=1 Tax=Candidatus Abyssobacteria bacterium SURF_17 TaxID=2093361 RepID=A0A419ESY5_9BACT|nr:MAG: pyridoxamine 5'-phosphate oxidase [Candidatus Abyssubacteria bacterium SURF_17]
MPTRTGEQSMGKLSHGIKEFLAEERLAYVATSSREGVPNVVPKGSLGVLDDDHLVFADLYSQKTRRNIEENPHVSVAVVNPAAYEGYQFKGTAQIVDSGPALERAIENVASIQVDPAKVKYAVVITVEEVYDLAPGPTSGKRIA